VEFGVREGLACRANIIYHNVVKRKRFYFVVFVKKRKPHCMIRCSGVMGDGGHAVRRKSEDTPELYVPQCRKHAKKKKRLM